MGIDHQSCMEGQYAGVHLESSLADAIVTCRISYPWISWGRFWNEFLLPEITTAIDSNENKINDSKTLTILSQNLCMFT